MLEKEKSKLEKSKSEIENIKSKQQWLTRWSMNTEFKAYGSVKSVGRVDLRLWIIESMNNLVFLLCDGLLFLDLP